jgi:hypothetical protein
MIKRFVPILVGLVLINTWLTAQNNLEPIFKNGYWSVIDTSLNVLFPYGYDEVKIAGPNTALAKKAGKFYLLKSCPAEELPLNFVQVKLFGTGLLQVTNNGLHGLIDLEGRQLVPIHYTEIWSPTKDLAILKSENKQQYYHYNTKFLSLIYDKIELINKEVYALHKDGQFNLFDAGRNMVSLRFSELNQKHPHFFFCTDKQGKKFVVMQQESFLYAETDYFYYNNDENRFVIYRLMNTMRVYDKEQKQSYNVEFEQIKKLSPRKRMNSLGQFFDDGSIFFAYWKGGGWGLMDNNLKVLIKPEYDSFLIEDEHIVVALGDKTGMADFSGRIVIPAKYHKFSPMGNFWLVALQNKYGVLNLSGTELIRPMYDYISQVFTDKFVVKANNGMGLIDVSNRVVLPLKYDGISRQGSYLRIEKDKKYGLASESGNIIVTPRHDMIYALNSQFFCVGNDKKFSLMDLNGKLLFEPLYKEINSTDNPYVFMVSSFEACTLTKEELKDIFGINYREKSLVFDEKRFKTGLINSSGQILLEPVYDPYQISLDAEANNAIVKEEQGVLVVTFDKEGKLIDKIKYRNYISVSTEKEENKRTIIDSLPFRWQTNRDQDQKNLFGLFHTTGRKAIDYYYEDVWRAPFNPELSITLGPKKMYGLVSRRTAKILLQDVYRHISHTDLQKASFIRCFRNNGTISLIDSNGQFIERNLAFIDDIDMEHIRANKGGKSLRTENDPKQLYERVPTRGNQDDMPVRQSRYINGGSWGVMGLDGKFLISPKYQFLQAIFKGVFIAELSGKWGVISPKDSVLIPFRYDEIRHFTKPGSATWANTPYYKIRLDNKWGVIDSMGNTILDAQFDDIEHIYTFGRYYFKTQRDYSKTPFGLIGQNGEMVIEPGYQSIGPFVNGFAQVSISQRNWIFINTSLHAFPDLPFMEIRDYRDGLAAVKNKDGWGFIDTTGNIRVANQYTEVGDFYGPYAKVKVKLNSKLLGLIKSKMAFDIIDQNGRTVYKTKAPVCGNVSNGLVVVGKNRKYTVRTIKGKKVLPGKYVQITEIPNHGLYLVRDKNRQLALFNKKGKIIVPFGQYRHYGNFSEGLCYVSSGQESGFIDTTGFLKFKIKCEEAKGFSENLAAVKISRQWGYIDTTGQLTIQPQYLQAGDFNQGVAIVSPRESANVAIDRNNQVIPNEQITWPDGFRRIEEKGDIGLSTIEGRVFCWPVFNRIDMYSYGYAPVRIEKLYGLYNQSGQMLVRDKTPQIKLADNGLIQVIETNQMWFLK